MLRLLPLVFATYYFTQSAADSDSCVFVSTHQYLPTLEYTELLDMDMAQCIEPKTGNSGNIPIICEYGDKNVYLKPECFCAGIKVPPDLKCDQNQLKLCCEDNVVCFNGGQLIKEESNCTAKPEPIFKCKCPTVLDESAPNRYHGDRCQEIPVIRKCKYQPTVNESYRSCDDENNMDSPCIYSVIDTPFECEPVQRNTTGMKFTKCERRYNASVTDRRQQNTVIVETPGDTGKSCEDTVSITVPIVIAVVAVVIILVLIYFVIKQKLRYHACSQHQMVQFDPHNNDDETEEDEETDIGRSPHEGRPFLRRSLSVPASGRFPRGTL